MATNVWCELGPVIGGGPRYWFCQGRTGLKHCLHVVFSLLLVYGFLGKSEELSHDNLVRDRREEAFQAVAVARLREEG